jgi:glycosyltransferase involved in cell wall biosynthesis
MDTTTTGRGAARGPTISVVIPAFNAGRYLREALDSVLSQTVGDVEVVVVDDASSDATWTIIEEYAARDDRVRGLHNEQNLGIAASLNRGIEAAASQLIGRMDADDISVPHRFERQLALLEAHPEVAVVGSHVLHINDRADPLGVSETGPASVEEFQALRRVGRHTMVFGGTAVFRKRLALQVGGYDPGIATAEDLEFFDRMAEHGAVVAISEPLVLYRIHPGSHVMQTFFHGRAIHRYVADRRRRQLAGEPEIGLAEYRRVERSRSWARRASTRINDLSRYLYRRAGVEVALGRRARALGLLALAATASPRYSLPRIWSQRLSPTARRARAAGNLEMPDATGVDDPSRG